METTEAFDLRPFIDKATVVEFVSLIQTTNEPTPEMIEKAAQLFKETNGLTRLHLFAKLPRREPWLFLIHKKIGMLIVEAATNASGEYEPEFFKKAMTYHTRIWE